MQTVIPRACRICGCTDEDCSPCIEKTGAPCWWVAEDLCSACIEAAAHPGEAQILQIQATPYHLKLDGVPCRVWQGVDEGGAQYLVMVHRVVSWEVQEQAGLAPVSYPEDIALIQPEP